MTTSILYTVFYILSSSSTSVSHTINIKSHRTIFRSITMTNEDVGVAPSLSTYQDTSAFEFQKYEQAQDERKHLSLEPIRSEQALRDLIYHYYSIEDTVKFLNSTQFNRVTLQFPDELVCDSSTVSQLISAGLEVDTKIEVTEAETAKEAEAVTQCKDNCGCGKDNSDSPKERSVWILADTSYSPCCVDEVSAEHVKGDVVIHYGDACLNPVSKVKVAYVFGKPAFDSNTTIQKFKERYPDTESKVLLMANAPYSYALKELYHKLTDTYKHIAYADISQDSFPDSNIIGYTPQQSAKNLQLLNRCFHGLEEEDEQELEEVLMTYEVFHLSIPESPRLLKLTTVFDSVTLYNPQTSVASQGPFPNLMRRYRYMHVARSAGTVGLLVNTLSLANTKLILDKLKEKVRDAGKKHYMFVVGKPNVAKLANFESIDIWCILGCDHQGIIIDQTNEYYKPIITPFELLLALNQELTWTGKWETDFAKLLVQLGEEEPEQEQYNESDDEPTFDVVTGKFTSSSKPLKRPSYLEIESSGQDPQDPQSNTDSADSNALIERFSRDVVIKNTVSTAAIHLQNRAWTGLGSDYVDDEPEGAMVEDGIKGVARGYEFDMQNKNQKN